MQRGQNAPSMDPAPRHVALLTATLVAPHDARNLARRDPALRLQDYLQAFDFYLDHLARGTMDALVLCDNSGHDLAAFVERVATAGLQDRVELLSHQGLDYPAQHGRGYGEFKLVDHAMHTSKLIAAMGPHARIWKLTGRYKLLNLERLVRSHPPDADLYCHCRDHPKRWLDMYAMCWNQRAYAGLIRGVYRHLRQDDTPVSAEQRFRVLLDNHRSSLRVVRRFAVVPRVDGVRGFDNRPYSTLWRQHAARVVAHRLLPWVWI